MSSSGGLVQRRRNAANTTDHTEYDAESRPSVAESASPTSPSGASNPPGSLVAAAPGAGTHDAEHYDGRNYDDDNDGKAGKNRGLTLMEEILLLGYKDSEGRLSFWNDNISYVLRGAILMELSLRNRINTVKEPRKRPFAERLIEVTDDRLTGEVLLDEALKYIKTEVDSIGNWVDLLSGETWNLSKIGYQLKQVRERIAKGLVDKGVLRTDKLNLLFFDVPTHPLAEPKVKEEIIQRAVDCLLGRGTLPNRRTIAMVCAAYAANVLENALVGLSHAQRESAFQKADELLQEHANLTDRAKSVGTTEVMAGVFNVYAKMDSIL